MRGVFAGTVRVTALGLAAGADAGGAAAADPAFQGDQQRDVHGHGIGPAEHQFGQMLGHGDPAPGDQRQSVRRELA